MKSSDWINIKKQLPKININDKDDLHTSDEVIALTSDGFVFKACRARFDDEDREWWAVDDFGGFSETTDDITHFIFLVMPNDGDAP